MNTFDISVQDILNEHNSENKENDGEDNTLLAIKINDQKKRTCKKRNILNTHKLLSDVGLPALQNTFKDFKFKGKGHEEEDFEVIMTKYEIWAAQLNNNMSFIDCIDKIEQLGRKRDIQHKLMLYREQGIFYFGSSEIVDDEQEYQAESFADDNFSTTDMMDVEGGYNSQNIHTNISSANIRIETPEERSARIESNRLKALEKLALKQRKKIDDDLNEIDMEDIPYPYEDEEMPKEMIPDYLLERETTETQRTFSQMDISNTSEEISARIERNRKEALEKLMLKQAKKGRKSFLEMAMSQVEDNV